MTDCNEPKLVIRDHKKLKYSKAEKKRFARSKLSGINSVSHPRQYGIYAAFGVLQVQEQFPLSQ